MTIVMMTVEMIVAGMAVFNHTIAHLNLNPREQPHNLCRNEAIVFLVVDVVREADPETAARAIQVEVAMIVETTGTLIGIRTVNGKKSVVCIDLY
jgi:hypothetical protein